MCISKTYACTYADSNTTFVKVKLTVYGKKYHAMTNSNTTFVKVKYGMKLYVYDTDKNSNTTFVKVK